MNRQAALDITVKISVTGKEMEMAVSRDVPSVSMAVEKSATVPDDYTGPYEATALLYEDLVLDTAWKRMTGDVTVKAVTIGEELNQKGGRTVIIGAV